MFTPIPGVRVIGVGHKARQGKDTFARMLAGIVGPTAARYAFADALKAVARAAHGMTSKDAPLLQLLGTEVYREGRTVTYGGRSHCSPTGAPDPNVWLRALYFRIAEERPSLAVITDVRFPNEIDLVRRMGGLTLRLQRVNAEGRVFIDPGRNPDHVSETALDDPSWWDCTLHNPELNPAEFERRIAAWWATVRREVA